MSKAFLITGCSSGIGRATAELLLKNGFVVYATARKPETITDLKNKGAVTLYLDVTNTESIKNVVAKIEKDEIQLYGLINNAGYGQMGPIEEITEEQAFNQMNTNVLGLASVTRHALPLIRKHQEGIIVNISSIAGKVSMPLSGWYCASKFAVEALSDALRLEVGQFGIKVITIEPGPIRTMFGETAYSSADHVPESSVYKSMINRLTGWSKNTLSDRVAGKPYDVANVIFKAVHKRNPRARYRVTLLAKSLFILRKYASDRLMDFLFRKQMGIKKF
ncbi:SDR family NAD(P)-dependent oxidoreductase [Saccharicrinis sp. FJH62]|uniref:SDR family NAD(P)-dependent oxidoreductase n=1 Tax=Saccharicrinis sp. FJH62 TaxID=3344657 RepID=UPI0035D4A93B